MLIHTLLVLYARATANARVSTHRIISFATRVNDFGCNVLTQYNVMPLLFISYLKQKKKNSLFMSFTNLINYCELYFA